MFTCKVFDFNEDTGYTDDWFTGYCWHCNLRIRRRWHAVRIPRPTGGWVGCYYSWRCARDALDDPHLPEVLTHGMIDYYERKINEIGIQDRLPDE